MIQATVTTALSGILAVVLAFPFWAARKDRDKGEWLAQRYQLAFLLVYAATAIFMLAFQRGAIAQRQSIIDQNPDLRLLTTVSVDLPLPFWVLLIGPAVIFAYHIAWTMFLWVLPNPSDKPDED